MFYTDTVLNFFPDIYFDRFTSNFDPMECLGSGAYGCVYKARHKLSNKNYAVKIVCRKREEE